MQGQDSVEINADIELGGTDQLFNCTVGRDLQKQNKRPGQVVLSMPLLVGLDGVEKMSKSKNNYIGLTEEPNDMYGKAMSIPDRLLENYLGLVTDFSAEEITQLKSKLSGGKVNPMDIKKGIAKSIVRQYHGAEAAEQAAEYFYNQFQLRTNQSKSYQPVSLSYVFGQEAELPLVQVCHKLDPNMSKTKLRQMIGQGGIKIDEVKQDDPMLLLEKAKSDGKKIQGGRTGFYQLKNEV